MLIKEVAAKGPKTSVACPVITVITIVLTAPLLRALAILFMKSRMPDGPTRLVFYGKITSTNSLFQHRREQRATFILKLGQLHDWLPTPLSRRAIR